MALSKDLAPLGNFGPIFFNNQFRVKIEILQRSKVLEGKVAIITGANSGLGFAASKQLLNLGLSRLILAVRSRPKGEEAASQLKRQYPNAAIDVWHLDMELYDSIVGFASKCDTTLPRLDMVILNAGVSQVNFTASKSTGHETTVQVNHLGTSLLAVLLLPVLKRKSDGKNPGRITVVNSIMAHLSKFTNRNERPLFSALDDPSKWDGADRYGISKLLNQLFLVKLTDQVSPDNVIINMVDPGLTKDTDLFRSAKGVTGFLGKALTGLAGRPVESGAATYVHAVLTRGKESHGCFLMNAEIAPYVYACSLPICSNANDER